MNIAIDDRHREFIGACIASGKFRSEAEVVNAALAVFEEQEELLAAIDEGTKDLEEGRYIDYGAEDFERFLKEVRVEGNRARDEDSACNSAPI
jgi:putative addiction module CopG family antidote